MFRSSFRPFIAAAVLVLACGTALAQYTDPVRNSGFDDGQLNWYALGGIGANVSPADRARELEIERKYRETLRTRIPDKKPSNDPWRSVRSAPAYDRHRAE